MNDTTGAPVRVIVSGGGTGGHIFPAISIANAIKAKYSNAKIIFVGAENRMEMKRVPAAGYEIIGLEIVGFERKHLFKNISVLWKLCNSLRKARKILKGFDPDIVIGVGGYASAPTLKTANSLGIPTLIQEQNSYAGVTNKLLAKKAQRICVAYDGMERFFPVNKIVNTGNPYRKDLLSSASREEAYDFFNLDPSKKTILVIGGSLGSKTLNDSLLSHMSNIRDSGIQILWQCGEYYFADLTGKIAKTKAKNIHLHDFINRMDLAYKSADLVISRAGAGAISELCLLGKPAILVPSPNVAEDHQTKNAMALVDKNAAMLVADSEAVEKLVGIALETLADESQLNTLSENILKLAKPNATEDILAEIIRIIEEKRK